VRASGLKLIMVAGAAVVMLLAAAVASPAASGRPGGLDGSFGGDGRIVPKLGGAHATSVVMQHSGRLVILAEGKRDHVLARFTRRGKLDRAYGRGGVAHDLFDGRVSELGQALALQSDGKLLVAGVADTATGEDVSLLRFKSVDGLRDEAFGVHGETRTDWGVDRFDCDTEDAFCGPGCPGFGCAPPQSYPSQDSAAAVIQLRDKTIAVTGTTGPRHRRTLTPFGTMIAHGEPDQVAVLRYSYAGTLLWKQALYFGALRHCASPCGQEGTAIARQRDGRILVGATIDKGSGGLARLRPDGSLDPSFSGDGKVTFGTRPQRILVQPDGRILVSGDGFVRRFTKDGRPDRGFGSKGVVYPFRRFYRPRPQTIDGNDIALQRDGTILTTGAAQVGPGNPWVIFRLLSNGKVDPRFGNRGYVKTQFPTNNVATPSAIVVGRGRFAVAGGTDFETEEGGGRILHADIAVAQYHAR
jgi:uncharacterized delta-60 repeat protein